MPVPVLSPTPPATLAGSGVYTSNPIDCNDIGAIAASALLSGSGSVGTLTAQRYLDGAATIPIGAELTANMTGGTVAVVDVSDGLPFGSVIITVTNSTGGTLNLSKVYVRTIAP